MASIVSVKSGIDSMMSTLPLCTFYSTCASMVGTATSAVDTILDYEHCTLIGHMSLCVSVWLCQ